MTSLLLVRAASPRVCEHRPGQRRVDLLRFVGNVQNGLVRRPQHDLIGDNERRDARGRSRSSYCIFGANAVYAPPVWKDRQNLEGAGGYHGCIPVRCNLDSAWASAGALLLGEPQDVCGANGAARLPKGRPHINGGYAVNEPGESAIGSSNEVSQKFAPSHRWISLSGIAFPSIKAPCTALLMASR